MSSSAPRVSVIPRAAADILRTAARQGPAACVCFDVDSTVITTEGIDELAAALGRGDDVRALTARAMAGGLPFREALRERLDMLQVSAADLARFVAEHPPVFTPGVEAFIARLRACGVAVFLVSGGFTQMIAPVAARLGLPPDAVYANVLLHDASGRYIGFDESAPTSRDGGKPRVLASLRNHSRFHTMVMVGDGATDMQTRTYVDPEARDAAGPAADLFIGYGGVVVRDSVRAGADAYVYDFRDLTALLNDL